MHTFWYSILFLVLFHLAVVIAWACWQAYKIWGEEKDKPLPTTMEWKPSEEQTKPKYDMRLTAKRFYTRS